jgi:hypothetical protein
MLQKSPKVKKKPGKAKMMDLDAVVKTLEQLGTENALRQIRLASLQHRHLIQLDAKKAAKFLGRK